MILLLEQSLNGLQFGLMLFLLAAGLTLVFGIMDMINRHTLIERGRVVWRGDSARLAAEPGVWPRYFGV